MTLSVRILLLGSRGQVGWELQRALAPLGEGPHTVYLQLANADHVADPGRLGAVTSDVVRVAVVVDLQPPVVRRVQVAGGQVLVNRLTVPVTVGRCALWRARTSRSAASSACWAPSTA